MNTIKFRGIVSIILGEALAGRSGMEKPKSSMLFGLCLLFSLSDGNAQWMRAYTSGKADLSIGSLVNLGHAVFYYAGDSSGILASTDEGKTWTPENAGLPLDSVGSLPPFYDYPCKISIAGGRLFAAMNGYAKGLFVSENAGATWKTLPWSQNQYFNWITVASDGSTYYGLDDRGFLYSFRPGDSALISKVDLLNRGNAIPNFQSSAPHPVFTDLLIRKGIFLANTWTTVTLAGGVLISRDSGKSWGPSSLKDTGVFSIAGNDEFVFAMTGRGIYRSADNGVTWGLLGDNVFADTSASGKVHWTSIYASGKGIFAGFFRDSPNGMIADRQDILYSDDNGENWKSIGTGITFPQNSYPGSITQSDSSVFAVVGKELWKRPLREFATGIHVFGHGNSKSGSLSGNRVALRAGDRLEFVVEKSGWVDLGLYDGAGRCLQTLVRSEMPAGPRSIPFSPARNGMGQLFLRLRTPGISDARKVLIEN